MNVWISYARASTEEQSTSCAQQHADNGRAAASAPAATFDDDGVPGRISVDSRSGLSRLCEFLRAAPARTYEVRCYDTSRLGRFDDPEYHFVAEWLLKQAGARRVVFTKGAFTEGRSIANSVLKIVEAHSNRAYCEKLSRDVHRGLIAAVREGKRSGGIPPWGYDVEYPDYDGKAYARVRYFAAAPGGHTWSKEVTYLEDGRREIIPPEHQFISKVRPVRSRLVLSAPERVEAVRQIFNEYLKGVGFRTIARKLQASRLPSPHSDEWTTPGVRSIIVNPVYCGKVFYGRRSESKYHALEAGGVVRERAEGEQSQKKQIHIADEAKWVVSDEAHEPIISEEMWRAANEVRSKRDVVTGGRLRGRAYLLSGHLLCPRCGRNYTGHTTKNTRGYASSHYICGNYERGGVCSRGPISRTASDEAVLAFLSERYYLLKSAEQRETKMRESIVAETGAPIPPIIDERPAELKAIEKELKGIVDHVAPENLALFNDRLAALRKRREALAADIASSPTRVPSAPPSCDIDEAQRS